MEVDRPRVRLELVPQPLLFLAWVELGCEPALRPVLSRPCPEVVCGRQLDGQMLRGADDDPRPVGVVLDDGEAERRHEHMFAHIGNCADVAAATNTCQ